MFKVKNILKKVSQGLSCSFGLCAEDGTFLAPISEDRVFFLLELDQIAAANSNSTAPFVPKTSNISKDSLVIIFSPFVSQDPATKGILAFQPVGDGTWNMIFKNKKHVVMADDIPNRIQENCFLGGERPYSYTFVEQELYGLLLVVSLVCIWKFRRSLPWLCYGVLLLHNPLEAGSDISTIANVAMRCGEKELAEKYLLQKYLTDPLETNRSVYAYDLALLFARFQEIPEALYWAEQINSDVIQMPEAKSLLRDVLSTAILDGTLKEKGMLQKVLQTVPTNPLACSALLFQGNVLETTTFGIDEVLLSVTSPALHVLPKTWEDELKAFVGGTSSSIEQALILYTLSTMSSSWQKIELLTQLGFREARLYGLLYPNRLKNWNMPNSRLEIQDHKNSPGYTHDDGDGLVDRDVGEGKSNSSTCLDITSIQLEQEQNAVWMKNLLIQCAQESHFDNRIQAKASVELLQKAWDKGSSLCEKWDYVRYMVKILKPDETSPWQRALCGLQSLHKPQGALTLALQAFFVSVSVQANDFQSELSSFLDSFFSVEGRSMNTSEFLAIAQSLSSVSDPAALSIFLQKSCDFFEHQEGLGPVDLVHEAMSIIQAMITYRNMLNNDQSLSDVQQLARYVSQVLQPQVVTKQEKQLVDELLGIQGTMLEILEKTYDVLTQLDYLFQQRNIESVSYTAPVGATSNAKFVIDKEDAIQLLLQLEQDERALVKRVE